MLILLFLKFINSCSFKSITLVPSTKTSPDVGSINRLIWRISVDFPDPESPMQTKVSPSSIAIETLSSPTVCPVSSKISSFESPFITIGRTSDGSGPKIL